MRLLFAADLQLGSGRAYGTPEVSRLDDVRDYLDAILELADEHNVSNLVIAGDVFNSRRPGVDELLAFKRFAARAGAEGHRLIMLVGNHDRRGPLHSTVLDLFAGVDNVVASRPRVLKLRAYDTRPDVFLGLLPWAHPAQLRGGAHGGAGVAEASPQALARMLEELAAGLRAETAADPAAKAILVTHYALSGMSLPTGLSTGELASSEPVLDTHALLAQGWSYVFAGHVHKAEVFAAGRPDDRLAVSIGSPWVQDFGEAADEHGVWIVDTNEDSLAMVPIDGRRFVTIDVDLVADPEANAMLRAARAHDLKDAVVRARIRCAATDAGLVDVGAFRSWLVEQGVHKVHSIELDVEREARARAHVTEDSEPLSALDAWSAASGLESRERGRLRDLTVSLLEEE